MPRGVPALGQALTSSAEELTIAPVPKVLGDVSAEAVDKLLKFDPPPWEVDPRYHKHNTDARRFVDCPAEVELRWINPKQLDHVGWRDWKAVHPSDRMFKVKNKAMIAVDNTVRRGGAGGDILAWMPREWVESRNRLKAESVRKHSQSAVDRQQALQEEVRRGHFYKMSVDSAVHPSHTQGLGSDMKKDG